MRRKYDVIISGAGPSGSLLGFLLASNNIKTLIIEKKKFPRNKICAGGLQHRVLNLLPFSVEDQLERKISAIRFSKNFKDPFEKESSDPIMYTVQRTVFDDFMAKKALSMGCDIVFCDKIQSVDVLKERLKIQTSAFDYDSKVLVGADGANGYVHKTLIGNNKYIKVIGYEAEINFRDSAKKNTKMEILKNKDIVFIDFGCAKKGYLWVFPKKDSFSIGSGGPYKSAKMMKKYLKSLISDNFLHDPMINAHIIPVGNKRIPVASNRIITIGDAACLGDGFTGEGLYNAMRSSLMAYDCIRDSFKRNDYDFNHYSDLINKEILSDIRASLFFSKIFFSSFFFYYKLLKNKDVFFHSCCKILRGEKTYKSIMDRLNLLK
jgi:geranylgeranyl reductase family protein